MITCFNARKELIYIIHTILYYILYVYTVLCIECHLIFFLLVKQFRLPFSSPLPNPIWLCTLYSVPQNGFDQVYNGIAPPPVMRARPQPSALVLSSLIPADQGEKTNRFFNFLLLKIIIKIIKINIINLFIYYIFLPQG